LTVVTTSNRPFMVKLIWFRKLLFTEA